MFFLNYLTLNYLKLFFIILNYLNTPGFPIRSGMTAEGLDSGQEHAGMTKEEIHAFKAFDIRPVYGLLISPHNTRRSDT